MTKLLNACFAYIYVHFHMHPYLKLIEYTGPVLCSLECVFPPPIHSKRYCKNFYM